MLTGLLLLWLVSEACQSSTSARVSIECHWLACTGNHLAENHRTSDWLMIQAMDLAMFCDILSAMGPPCGPFHLEKCSA